MGRTRRAQGDEGARLIFVSSIPRCCFSPEGHVATFPQLRPPDHSLPCGEDRAQEPPAVRTVRASHLHMRSFSDSRDQ